jgi:magnesium-transporting ATPase (P-type)
MSGPRRQDSVVDGAVLRRAFLVLGPLEALVSMAAFLWVLDRGGWSIGGTPDDVLLASASGTAFAAIALGQVANAFACRSESHPVWRLNPWRNPLVLAAVGVEIGLLLLFLGTPWLADLLGGSWPPAGGWLWAVAAAPALVLVDATQKALRRRRGNRRG